MLIGDFDGVMEAEITFCHLAKRGFIDMIFFRYELKFIYKDSFPIWRILSVLWDREQYMQPTHWKYRLLSRDRAVFFDLTPIVGNSTGNQPTTVRNRHNRLTRWMRCMNIVVGVFGFILEIPYQSMRQVVIGYMRCKFSSCHCWHCIYWVYFPGL